MVRDRTYILKENERAIDTVAAKGQAYAVFRYERDVPKGVQDGFHSEELLLPFRDGKLQADNALFGRFCYCKGETGYFAIPADSLRITGKDGRYTVDFRLSEGRQTIGHITVSLK